MSYARKCSITGKGMNEGWVILDGEMYIADEENVLEQVKKVGYASLEEAFDDEYCYWTEWDAENYKKEVVYQAYCEVIDFLVYQSIRKKV